MVKLIKICSFCWLAALASCAEMPENAPTYGTTRLVADETLYPVVDALVSGFEHSYPKTKVEVEYLPEHEAFQAFYEDSTFVIVCARQLNEREVAHFKSKSLNPRTGIMANDAIALLINPANPDTNLTCESVKKLLDGTVTDWKSISNANQAGAVNIVFDNQGSSTLSFVLEKIGKPNLPANSYALKTTAAVVDYVNSHAGALGIIGYSWLSDYDDPECRAMRSKVKILAISPCGDKADGQFYRPFSSNVQDELYPFSRQIFVINRETSSGTGTGLAAFMAGEIGQRIISKAGILPAYKVEHNIELKSESFRLKK